MVKKIDIAHRLGLHVATVSRILNQVPGYRASKATVEKVFKVAREMGYDFARQKRFYRRRHLRLSYGGQVKLRARQGNGSVVMHSARMANIGEGGALLCNFKPTLATLPLREEDLALEVVSGNLAGIQAACEVVRVGPTPDGGLGVCVSMKGLSPRDAARIQRFIAAATEGRSDHRGRTKARG